MLSKKHAARRPRPPLPSAASCSCDMTSSIRNPSSSIPAEASVSADDWEQWRVAYLLQHLSSRHSTWHCPLLGPSGIPRTDLALFQHCNVSCGNSLTVDALLVCEGLSLLCLVPFYDQSIPEGEGGSGICGSGVGQALALGSEIRVGRTIRHN